MFRGCLGNFLGNFLGIARLTLLCTALPCLVLSGLVLSCLVIVLSRYCHCISCLGFVFFCSSLVSSWFVLSRLVSCCFVVSCLVLSFMCCIVLPGPVLFCLSWSLSCLAWPVYRILSCQAVFSCCLVLSCLVLSCLLLCCLVFSCLVLSCAVLSGLYFFLVFCRVVSCCGCVVNVLLMPC